MQFDLTDLRLFVHVHEAGSITGGAQRSHLALASASERIRNLEVRLGTPLLVRSQRGVQPTAAGHTLLHHARQVLRQMEHLNDDMANHSAGLAGHVRVLCNTSALSEHLPPRLPAFLAAHPRVSVELQESSSQDVADALHSGMAELGVVSNSAALQGLQTLPFAPDPLVLALPASHALAGARSARLADVLQEDFIGLPAQSALQAMVNTQAKRLGRQLNYRARLGHLEAVCRLVGLGAGVAVVPQAVARRHARALHIRPVRLADAWAQRNLVLCMRDLAALPPFTRALVAHLQMPSEAPAPASRASSDLPQASGTMASAQS